MKRSCNGPCDIEVREAKGKLNMDGKDRRDTEILSTRRGLLSVGAAAATLGVVEAAASADDPGADQRKRSHIIVIGGGFCGVTAARDLRKQGHRVTILEARNRLGGRTFTAPFAGKDVDMGGTWIHWLQPHVWSEFRRYGMQLAETKGAVAPKMIYLDYDANRHEVDSADVWPEFASSMSRYFGDAYQIMPRPAEPFAESRWAEADRVSVQDKLDEIDLSETSRILIDALLTTYGSAPASEVSWIDMMRWYALSGYSTDLVNDATARYKIVGGTQALLHAIADDADAEIKLSSAVIDIKYDAGSVVVTTDYDEVYTADAVVLAVPMNVLKDINFDPKPGEDKRKAIAETLVGHGTKVHVIVDKEYPMFSGLAPTGDAALNFLLWDSADNGKTHLIGFGPSTDTLDVNDIDAVQSAVAAFLPGARVLEAYGYQWSLDPYSKGVWGVSGPGQMSKHIGALQEPMGRIHFANADWANGWRGFIDGAIEQGIVAARNVHAQLSPAVKGESK